MSQDGITLTSKEDLNKKEPRNIDREAATAEKLSNLLPGIAEDLGLLCTDSEPHFVRTGAELRTVSREIQKLVETIRTTAELTGRDERNRGALTQVKQLVQDMQANLTDEKHVIASSLDQVRELIQLFSSNLHIYDTVDRIRSSFMALRINIRIQCSVHLISDETFKDVTDDIEALSETLVSVTRQIKIHLATALKNLSHLEQTVTDKLKQSNHIANKGGEAITKALADIERLVNGSATLMTQAETKSRNIADKINDVVVAIQFHDSLSQRSEHAISALNDSRIICSDVEGDGITARLGTAYLILEMQLRQLAHIQDEISVIHDQIKNSFTAMKIEVEGLNSILRDSQFRAIGPEQFLASLFGSLKKALIDLAALLPQSDDMLNQISTTSSETRLAARQLVKTLGHVNEMRDATRLQAVNTIIMATNLGKRGRTIQILAKEIRVLADQTSDLFKDVTSLQETVNQKVESLCGEVEKNRKIKSSDRLEDRFDDTERAFKDIESSMRDVSAHISTSCAHIDSAEHNLTFLHNVQQHLATIITRLQEAKDLLAPWRNQAPRDSPELEQLVKRYTMEQERLIHMFDRVVSDTPELAEESILF